LVDKFFEDKIAFPRNRTIYIEAVEENKNLLQAESCLVELSNFGMRKSDSLVVVGGGCVQDIGTNVASLFMRGVKWIYVPTTLAAMGDSCLGGKSSINAGTVKNLVGNFYPPSQVLVDTRFVQSLPPLEQVAGISEIVKICFARSMTNFLWARRILDNLELFENRVLSDELVHLSLISKRYFIEEDEHDTGVRKLLNFGHSFGHAIETASGYRIPHGVAVMVGMIAAIEHPKAIRTVSTDQLKVLCLKFLSSVSEEIRYPLRNLDFEKFSEAIKRDKKNTKNALVLVLPTDIGLALEYSNFDEGAVNIATRATESACKEILNEIC
jgi:3-dehydroquinate synthase